MNLISLELIPFRNTDWNYLKQVSLPVLKILKAQRVPSTILASLIENTNGHLSEISVQHTTYENDNNLFIQSIYKNCPNLQYLKLLFNN